MFLVGNHRQVCKQVLHILQGSELWPGLNINLLGSHLLLQLVSHLLQLVFQVLRHIYDGRLLLLLLLHLLRSVSCFDLLLLELLLSLLLPLLFLQLLLLLFLLNLNQLREQVSQFLL